MLRRGWHFDYAAASATTTPERERIGSYIGSSKEDSPVLFRLRRTGVLLRVSLDDTMLWQIGLADKNEPATSAVPID